MKISKYYIESIVLAVISRYKEGTYAYEIGKMLEHELHLSEAVVYGAFKKFEENKLIRESGQTYIVNGRNRKYYYITEKGKTELENRRKQWKRDRQFLETWLNA